MSAREDTIAVNGVFLDQEMTGVQRYAAELLEALCAVPGRRFRFAVMAPRRGSEGAAAPGDRLILDPSRLPKPLWIQWRLPKLYRREGAGLLWSPTNAGPLSVRRQVVTMFDAAVFAEPRWFSPSFRLYYRALLPRLARRAARVVTISEFSRGELSRHLGLPADRIDVVPCGVSRRFHPGADSSEWCRRKPYCLVVSSRNPRKNLAAILRAWGLLDPSLSSERRLLVAGPAARIYAEEALGQVPPGVEFLGFVPEGSLPGLYAGAEAFVYPSLYEGFGLPPLEAMACGTPTLVSRAASLPEVCGEAALYSDPLDSAGMARALEALLTDEALRARLRDAGIQRSHAFTWEEAAKRMLFVLDKTLAG